MSWVQAIRETLDTLAKVTDPVWRAECASQVDGLQKAAEKLTAIYAEELAERGAKLSVPKPVKPRRKTKPKSPDADTVGTVKNIRPKRPFVHDVPPAALPRGHR